MILEATLRMLEERSLADITMTAIADEAGISRAWLYRLFPDLATLYSELFMRMQPIFFHTFQSRPPIDQNLREYLSARCDHYLDMPVGVAILGSYALNGGQHSSATFEALRGKIFATLEEVWVDPIVPLGNDRVDVRAKVLVFMNTLFGLVIAMNAGDIDRPSARSSLEVVIDAVARSLNGLTASP
jgi:AcrR family transcriptional regulator